MLQKDSKKIVDAYSLVLEYEGGDVRRSPEEGVLDQTNPEDKKEVNQAMDEEPKAKITNFIPVTPSEHMGKKRLTIDVPNGWDDLKKLVKKVLEYNGEFYSFTGWNSDRNVAFFVETSHVAKIK